MRRSFFIVSQFAEGGDVDPFSLVLSDKTPRNAADDDRHLLHPLRPTSPLSFKRRLGSFAKDEKNVGTGLVGAPACGDVMKLQVSFNERSWLGRMPSPTTGILFLRYPITLFACILRL